MNDDRRRAALARLEPFLGEWQLEASFPGAPEAGSIPTRFEWELGGQYLVQRTQIASPPEAPDSLMFYDVDRDGDGYDYVQHYFDSRGVTRIYSMRLEGGVWTLTRESADFSELSFRQRWCGRFSEDGSEIVGRWEIAHDGKPWETDFDLTYRRP